MKTLKTMIKLAEGVGTSFSETMAIFKNESFEAKMQEFKIEEQAKKHLDNIIDIINESAKNLDFRWELAITCCNVELNGRNILDMRIIENQDKNSTCYIYIVEE